MPEELTGGLGAEGVKALREYVERGGTLVCLNNASNFAIEQLSLPVRDVTADPVARVRIPQRVPYGFHAIWIDGELL